MFTKSATLFATALLFCGCGDGPEPQQVDRSAAALGIFKVSAHDPGGGHEDDLCLSPPGIDLCKVLGVDSSFVFRGVTVKSGEAWIPFSGWSTNAPGGVPGYPLTYRPGYASPFPSDPMRDFRSKLTYVKVRVDAGTAHERTHRFDHPDRIVEVRPQGQLAGPGPVPALDAAPAAAIIPELHPLSVGVHKVKVSIGLAAEHCDGFPSFSGEPLTDHCLPAGESCLLGCAGMFTFTVAP